MSSRNDPVVCPPRMVYDIVLDTHLLMAPPTTRRHWRQLARLPLSEHARALSSTMHLFNGFAMFRNEVDFMIPRCQIFAAVKHLSSDIYAQIRSHFGSRWFKILTFHNLAPVFHWGCFSIVNRRLAGSGPYVLVSWPWGPWIPIHHPMTF